MYSASRTCLAMSELPIARVSLHIQDSYVAVADALADQLCGATRWLHRATRASQAAWLSCSDICPGA